MKPRTVPALSGAPDDTAAPPPVEGRPLSSTDSRGRRISLARKRRDGQGLGVDGRPVTPRSSEVHTEDLCTDSSIASMVGPSGLRPDKTIMHAMFNHPWRDIVHRRLNITLLIIVFKSPAHAQRSLCACAPPHARYSRDPPNVPRECSTWNQNSEFPRKTVSSFRISALRKM